MSQFLMGLKLIMRFSGERSTLNTLKIWPTDHRIDGIVALPVSVYTGHAASKISADHAYSRILRLILYLQKNPYDSGYFQSGDPPHRQVDW